MKKKSLLLTCAALAIAVSVGFGVSQTNASATAEQESRQVATQYLNALNDGNAAEAAKYVEDYRYNTQTELVEGYKELLMSDPVSNAKVLSVSAQGGNRATVTIGLSSQNAEYVEQTLTVEKKDGVWKVLIEQTPMVKAKYTK